jgi:hypothetical protein
MRKNALLVLSVLTVLTMLVLPVSAAKKVEFPARAERK